MQKQIKEKIKPLYIYLLYIYNRYIKQKQFKPYTLLNKQISLETCDNSDTSFFGYYNISPENINREIVYNTLKSGESVNINLKQNGQKREIGNSSSFNLQQGCMTQWGYKSQNLVYYNRFNNSNKLYEMVVYDINTNSEEIFPLPLYALSKQEDYILSLNFERLAVMRPDYGYFCKEVKELPSNEQDGIWKMDLKTKEISLIISLEQLRQLNPVETMQNAMHKVNHIDISPDGKRFMFLHRWVGPQGRYMRLITADSNGKNLYILNGDKMTSHSYWMNNKQIVSFCHTNLYGNAYTVFTDMTEKITKLSDKLPKVDGHPSTTKDGKWMITDTYPNKARMSKLYLYNIFEDQLFCIGSFYQPLKYKGTKRIDLHPKWNMNEDTIYFESGHSGKRKLYSINIESLLKK